VPRKVNAPVAVVVVLGATPAPPPITKEFAASAAEVAQVLALEKYGIPPDVPAIVNAGVVVGLVTVTIPPVQPTVVTVPDAVPAGVPQVPSPLQNVVALAEVPEFKFVTGRLPVTLVVKLTKVVEVDPVPPLAIGSVPVTPVVKGKPVALVSVTEDGVPSAGVTNVGEVAITLAPVPVNVLKSVYPNSQSAAVVNAVPIQVHMAVVPGITVITKFAPDELTVTLPVLLLTMWNVQPVTNVLVTGSTTVCVVTPVNCW
jgi:hypothetical protein